LFNGTSSKSFSTEFSFLLLLLLLNLPQFPLFASPSSSSVYPFDPNRIFMKKYEGKVLLHLASVTKIDLSAER